MRALCSQVLKTSGQHVLPLFHLLSSMLSWLKPAWIHLSVLHSHLPLEVQACPKRSHVVPKRNCGMETFILTLINYKIYLYICCLLQIKHQHCQHYKGKHNFSSFWGTMLRELRQICSAYVVSNFFQERNILVSNFIFQKQWYLQRFMSSPSLGFLLEASSNLKKRWPVTEYVYT